MQSSLYVGLSAQMNLQRLVDTIANNVANANTPGFRADNIQFESLVSQNTPEPVAFAGKGSSHISTAPGALTKTDNPLDVAVQGNAWFAMRTPGGTAYTRDGRLQISPSGDLQTVSGYPVLDVSGSPIQLNPNGGAPTVSADGAIMQGGRRVGGFGLYQFAPDAKLTRYDNSGVIPDTGATPVINSPTINVLQGYVEQSDVNPVSEISKLIFIQRNFDAVTSTLAKSESALQDAITSLGSTS